MIQHHEIVRCISTVINRNNRCLRWYNLSWRDFLYSKLALHRLCGAFNKPIDHLNDTRCDKKQTMKRHKIKIEFILNNKFDNHWRPSYQLLKLMDRRLHKNKHLTGKFLVIWMIFCKASVPKNQYSLVVNMMIKYF